MEIIGWIIAILFFIVAFLGLVYPIIPSALFILGGFLLYGLIVSFDGMNLAVLDDSNSFHCPFVRSRYVV